MAASIGCDAHDAGFKASARALVTQRGSQQPIGVAGVPGADLPRRACASSVECGSQANTPQAMPAAAAQTPSLSEGDQAQPAFPSAGQVSAAGANTAAGQPLDGSAARRAEQVSLPAQLQAGAAEVAPADSEHAAQGAAAEPVGSGKAVQQQAGQQEEAASPAGQADSANDFDAATRSVQHRRAASAGTATSPAPAGTKASPPASEGEGADTGTRQNPAGVAGAEAASAKGLLRPAEMPAEDDGGAEAPAQRQVVEPLAALASPGNVADAKPLLQAEGTGQAAPACRSHLETQAWGAAVGAGPSLAGGGTTNAVEPGPLLTELLQAADACAISIMPVPQTSKPAGQAGSPLAMPAKHPQGEPLLVRKHVLHDLCCMICRRLMCQRPTSDHCHHCCNCGSA